MDNCKICDSPWTMPYKLNCSHIFCFLCLKSMLVHNSGCPTCKTFITDDLNNVKVDNLYKFTVEHRKIFWLYSSKYPNYWWCNVDEISIQIENIYNDYLSRKNINDKEDNTTIIDVQIKDDNKKLVEKDEPEVDIIIDISMEILKNDADFKDNLIDYESDSSSSSLVDSFNEKLCAAPLSYLIKICGSEYKIDFDQMKQISVIDSNKKRFIKRIEVDGRIENIEKYLKIEYNILGVGGVKF